MTISKLCDKTKKYLQDIPYWHRDEIREIYKFGGEDKMMQYLDTLALYQVRVHGKTLNEITNGERDKFWRKTK